MQIAGEAKSVAVLGIAPETRVRQSIQQNMQIVMKDIFRSIHMRLTSGSEITR